MELNDYELVELAQDNNEEAINILYKKYEPIIKAKSKNALNYFKNKSIDVSDIMQEGFIGLDEAIKKFNQDSNSSFYTFVNICVDRQIFNYLKKNSSGKVKLLNEATYIDEVLEKKLSDDINIESDIVNNDFNKILISNVYKKLTLFEKKVFNLKYEGYSFEEIANTLDRDVKSIYNTFHRIKLKFQKFIDDN